MIVINVMVGLEIINLAFLVDSRITLIQDNDREIDNRASQFHRKSSCY